MAEYQSREKLISELEATKARLAALDQPVDAREAALMRQLDEAKAELAQAKPAAETSFPAGAAPKLVPYKGLAKASEDCFVTQIQHEGDVFEVDVSALWTDDPFVAVVIVGYQESGKPITEPNKAAPAQIDFRFRPKGLTLIDATPMRASQY